MILREPDYYEQFRCLAAACPDSCCQLWEVELDEEAAARYAALPGPLGQDIRAHMTRQADGSVWFSLEQARCPMWRSDGLCRIQAQLGHEALCRTCREFPRLCHDYGDFQERGLSLSCPAAAKLILSGPHGWVTRQLPGGEAGDYDMADFALLLETRDVMLTYLADPQYSAPEALALGLLYGYHVQTLLDEGEAPPFEPQAQLAFARQLARRSDSGELRKFYLGLDVLTRQWADRLAAPRPGENFPEQLRFLASYGVERYWLQAVSDLDLAGRVKMVIAGCVLVNLLGGDPVDTAQLYAKEIENSSENIDALLDAAYQSPTLTDDRLLGHLLLR